MTADRFRSWVLLIVLLYVALELAYMQRLPLVMDEFDGVHEAYRLRTDLPYRDYRPYKTVLGYYIQLPATFAAESVWGRIVSLKVQLIAINAAMLAAAAFYCARFLSRRAVALALALFAASTPMLERSSEIRVDMLTGWVGLWSFLLLVRGRYAMAGLLCTLSFTISQKAALYVLASNALLITTIAFHSDRRRALRGFLTFNAASAAALALYVAGWSIAAGPATVIETTFLSALRPVSAHGYTIRWQFWSQVLVRNFMFFLLAGAALWTLLRLKGAYVPWHSRAIAIYAAALLAQCIPYAQPWPYFFVILIPTLFVLVAAYFDHQDRVGVPKYFVMACLLLGVLYPLHRVFVILARSNEYQRYNVTLASALLDEGDTYLAANDVIHDHEQEPKRLARLDAIRLRELADESGDKHAEVIRQMDAASPKLVIGNYRIFNLPPALLAYIDRTYARISGSIRLYAPLVEAGSSVVDLKFAGRYRIESQSGGAASLGNRAVPSGTVLQLAAGAHHVVTESPLRLRLLPRGVEQILDPRFAAERPFYVSAYD